MNQNTCESMFSSCLAQEIKAPKKEKFHKSSWKYDSALGDQIIDETTSRGGKKISPEGDQGTHMGGWMHVR